MHRERGRVAHQGLRWKGAAHAEVEEPSGEGIVGQISNSLGGSRRQKKGAHGNKNWGEGARGCCGSRTKQKMLTNLSNPSLYLDERMTELADEEKQKDSGMAKHYLHLMRDLTTVRESSHLGA